MSKVQTEEETNTSLEGTMGSTVPFALTSAIRSQIVSRLNPQRASLLIRHLDVIYQILPLDEREGFLANPVEFVSAELLFRGMTEETMAECLREGSMQPRDGQMNSRAVFETDSPYFALTVESGAVPALAVIDQARIITQTGLLEAGSEQYRSLISHKLSHPPAGVPTDLYAYHVQNEVDTKGSLVPGHPWHNIELRLPQPLAEVNCFVLDRGGQPPLVLDPANPADYGQLIRIYLPSWQSATKD